MACSERENGLLKSRDMHECGPENVTQRSIFGCFDIFHFNDLYNFCVHLQIDMLNTQLCKGILGCQGNGGKILLQLAKFAVGENAM